MMIAFRKQYVSAQKGSALVFCVLILFLLTALGMVATKTTWLELDFASDDKGDKIAFYASESGQETAGQLIEESIWTLGWPNLTPIDSSDPEYDADVDRYRIGQTYILNRDLWENDPLGSSAPKDDDAARDAYVMFNDRPTSILVGGTDQQATGSALQQVAGYEGLGKSAAKGGTWLVYDIRDVHGLAANGPSVRIKTQWIHVVK